MYTKSYLSFDDDSTLKMYNLNAGRGLYGVETSEYNYPYNPSVAKPFHILWEYTDKYNSTFKSVIENMPDSVSFDCVFGRDGVNDTDWTVMVDNGDCVSSVDQEVIDFYFEQIGVSSPHSQRVRAHNPLSSAATWLIAAPVLGVLCILWQIMKRTRGNGKLSLSETAPLLSENLSVTDN